MQSADFYAMPDATDADWSWGGALEPWRYRTDRRDGVGEITACAACVQKVAGECPTCGREKRLDRAGCPECDRAFAVSAKQERTMAEVMSRMVGEAAERIAAQVKANEQAKETTMKTIDEKVGRASKATPDLGREMNNARWRAGIEIVTEEARDLIVSLLTDGMEESEAAIARPLFVKGFSGRFGVPIVAGAVGGVMYAVETSEMEVPLISPATAARIGEEMRTLSASSVMKVAYRSGRDLLARYGGRMLDAITNLGKLAEQPAIRVKDVGEAPPVAAATTATKSTRKGGFGPPPPAR